MASVAPCPEPTVSCGTLTIGEVRIAYSTRQPAPTQWIAMGLVEDQSIRMAFAARSSMPDGRRLLVGVGRTEDAAVHVLASRLARTGWLTDGCPHGATSPMESSLSLDHPGDVAHCDHRDGSGVLYGDGLLR